jgi:hypothetical protein
MHRMTLTVAIAAAIAHSAPLEGQIPAAPRELGMGGAYLGLARGYEAVFLAPANLALRDAPVWSLALPQVALGGTLLGPGVRDVMDLIDFNDLTGERQEELLALIPSSGTQASYSIRAPVVALSSGGVGLGLSYVSLGSHTLSRDLAELFLRGYEDGRAHYSVGNTSGDRATYWDAALALGRDYGPLSVGITGHYLRGRTLVRTQLFEPRVDVAAAEVEVDYVGALVRGGSGYAMDIGAAFQASPGVTLSGTLSNVLSSMDWSQDLRYRAVTLDRDAIENAGPLDLRNRYEGSETSVDPEAIPHQVEQAAQGLFEGAEFPAVVRLGLGWQVGPKTRVAADVHRKVGDGRLADPWDHRVAVGVDQSIWILGARAGYAVGSDGGNLLGLGFSLGPLDVGIARYQHSADGDGRNRGFIGTFGLGIAQPF